MRCCRSKNTLFLAAVAIGIYVVYHTDLLTSKPNHDEREREADRMDQKPDFESDDLMDGRRHRQDVDMRRRDRDPVNDGGGEAKMLRRNRIHDAGDVHMERDNGDDEDDGDRDASRHRIRAERLRATRAPLRHLKREESDRDVRRHNPQPDAPMGEPDEEDPHRRHPKYVEAAEILETPDDEELTKILMEMAAGKESSAFGGKLRKSVPYNKFSTNCTVNIAANVKVYTPFKIYILTLPARYNTDILKCVDKVFYDGCFKTDHCGFGPEMYSELSGDISARDSWQFSLDVIMHHKLLLSPYRTFNIHEADAIYVPYYAAGDCFCSQQKSDYPTVNENAIGLMQLIREHRPFVAKKPYVMTLGKIEREHMTLSCPWLLQKLVSYEMFYIGIEQESNARFRIANRKNVFPLILAPYPSYGHLATNGGKKYISALHASPRPVFMLLAAATRRSNPFRAKILDQFKDHKTNDRYEMYTRAKGITGSIELMHYVTPECRGDHSKYTMDWMKRATICLQPPGDSETRKSIYDSIISGCIPAFFEPEHPVKLPFSRTLDYESFSITIPRSVVSEDLSIIQFLKERYEPKYIKALQKNLKQVAKYFQYSFPVTNDEHTDAVKLILDDLQHTLEHN